MRRITKKERRSTLKDIIVWTGVSLATFSIYNFLTNSVNGLWLTILGIIIIIGGLWLFR